MLLPDITNRAGTIGTASCTSQFLRGKEIKKSITGILVAGFQT